MNTSITYARDKNGHAFGFICSCGFSYEIPSGLLPSKLRKSELLDMHIRHHENSHKLGAKDA